MRRALLLASLLSACSQPDVSVDQIRSANEPIIGGTVASSGIYPSVGALLVFGQAICTGTLISPTVVLTAAHCLDKATLGIDVLPSFTFASPATKGDRPIYRSVTKYIHPSFSAQR